MKIFYIQNYNDNQLRVIVNQNQGCMNIELFQNLQGVNKYDIKY